jgi:hypothetical protein
MIGPFEDISAAAPTSPPQERDQGFGGGQPLEEILVPGSRSHNFSRLWLEALSLVAW